MIKIIKKNIKKKHIGKIEHILNQMQTVVTEGWGKFSLNYFAIIGSLPLEIQFYSFLQKRVGAICGIYLF